MAYIERKYQQLALEGKSLVPMSHGKALMRAWTSFAAEDNMLHRKETDYV